VQVQVTFSITARRGFYCWPPSLSPTILLAFENGVSYLNKKTSGILAVILTGFAVATGWGYWHLHRETQKQVKATVSAYLQMPGVYAQILKKTYVVSQKSSADEQDKLVQEQILQAYRKILTGKILKNYETALRSYSIFSDDYQMLFSDLKQIKIEKILMVRKGERYLCTVFLVSTEEYGTDLYTPDLNSLIKDYQVTNYTQSQFNAVADRCELIQLKVRRKDVFKLIKTHRGWLIEDVNYNIEQSKLRMKLE
jgi:hypothetical protein